MIYQDYQDYVVIITNSTYTIFILIKYIISGIDHTIQTELTWNSAHEATKLYFYFYDNI